MINTPTVLILGAGASAPYGFPGGESLLIEASDTLEQMGSHLHISISNIFQDLAQHEIVDFGRRLRDSHQPSIDVFVSSKAQERFRDLGKAVIAGLLLSHENPNLFGRNDNDIDPKKWYPLLFRQLGVTIDDLFSSQKNLSIITLNYDRSLEYFLYNVLRVNHNSDKDLINAFIDGLPILHIYGSLGKLSHLSDTGVEYRSNRTASELHAEIDRTYHRLQILPDDATTNSEIDRARAMITSSEIICCLGFGYHETNLERLFGNFHATPSQRIFATTYGMGYGMVDRLLEYFHDKGFNRPRIDIGSPTEHCFIYLTNNYIFR